MYITVESMLRMTNNYVDNIQFTVRYPHLEVFDTNELNLAEDKI